MTQDYTHPITPPPELVDEWASMFSNHSDEEIFSVIAQWGSDQELEACCAELESIPSPLGIPFGKMAGNALRARRRPKLSSLKEQALDELHISFDRGYLKEGAADIIRRALEQLPDPTSETH